MLGAVASSRIVPEFWATAPPAVAGPAARPTTRRWRPFVSARSRILGWSVLLLAVAMAVSTVATG